MGKKLAIVLCALGLVGCAQTVDGEAVAEDAWDGRGVTPSYPTSTGSPGGKPAGFDPCGFDDNTLKYYVEVDPATKERADGHDGCSWLGDGFQFNAAIVEDVDPDSLDTVPGVTGLSDLIGAARPAQLFVFEQRACIVLTEIDGAVVELSIIEDDFDSSCFNLRVAAQLILAQL